MATVSEDEKLRQELRELQSLIYSFQKIFQERPRLDGFAILGRNMCKHPICAFRTHYPQSLLEHELKGAHYNFSAHQITHDDQTQARVSFPVPNSEECVSTERPEFESFSKPSADSNLMGARLDFVAANTHPGTTFTKTWMFPDSVAPNPLGNVYTFPAAPIQQLEDASRCLERAPSSDTILQARLSATLGCDTCFKQFTRVATLRDHLRSHNDVRPFPCNICGKAFARLKDRKRHETIHSGKKSYVCGEQQSDDLQWGCGRRFSREDGLVAHFRSETGEACLAPLLHYDELFHFLRASNNGMLVCKDAPERGKQWGCDAHFVVDEDLKGHFELSEAKSCIRQIVIRFALGLLRTSRDSGTSIVDPSAGELPQKKPIVLGKPSLTAWHPTAASGEPSMQTNIADSTEPNWIAIPNYELHLSHTNLSIESSIWEDTGVVAPQEPTTNAPGMPQQSATEEVASLVMNQFDSIPISQQWIIVSYRAGSEEAINAIIAIVISPHLLQDNTIWAIFGMAKCKAEFTTFQQLVSSSSASDRLSNWYEYRISVTVPPLSSTGSCSASVKLGLLIEYVSESSEESDGNVELSLGEFSYYGVFT